jgi:phosphatidylethanolamine/phosphatidyl-N-methylethanolamine N-methyltransferase
VKEERKSWNAGEAKARWDRLAKHYGIVEWISEWYLKPFRKILWAHAAGRILEAGAGTGLNIAFYPPGARVTATDLSGAMMQRARERARERKADVTFEQADLCALPFAESTFDTAAETFVFCAVPDPVTCLRELARVVKPTGRILLLDHVRIESPPIGALMDRLNPAMVLLAGEHINHRMDEFVRSAGLEVVENRRLGFMGILQFIVARPGSVTSL